MNLVPYVKNTFHFVSRVSLTLAAWLTFPMVVTATPPDLTTVDLSTVRANSAYPDTYNLGPTGLRGWIYVTSNSGTLNIGQEGLITDESRQILVTVVGSGTPADGTIAVNDVILGVGWGSGSTALPVFTSDARKSFGWAIGEAEKTENSGILRLKRWRAGVTTDVAITLPANVRGTYADTAPFSCPKSAQILANARNLFVNQVLADPNFLSGSSQVEAIAGLALLAAVVPGDPHYTDVQTRLQSYARRLSPANLDLQSTISTDWNVFNTWFLGYTNIFLSEYYLATGDASVLHGISEYTVSLAKAQSAYGTFGHSGSAKKPSGTLHGSIPPYGPVNSAGLPANISLVLGKKALQAGGWAIDPEIDPAIVRATNFFAWFVNKGPVNYGEHAPYMVGHASNGKDQMCALLFSLQDNRTTETEYFSRMAVAGYNGREYGHGGGQFGYLWGGIGANVGGQLAVAQYLKQVRWHLDLVRRTDGSFTFDGQEQYGPGKTADGTYLGTSDWAYSSNACYLLTYALPLQRLYITGKNSNPANTLDSTKVTNAIAAGTFKQTCTGYTVPQLIDALAEYDPIVRNYAVNELSTRTLAAADINNLITLAEGANVNQRQGACATLGLLKATGALPALGRRLNKTLEPDSWVRAQAAMALNNIGIAASSQLTPMLTAFTANAADPNLIFNATDPAAVDWSDPVQISNGYLAQALFYFDGGNTNSKNIYLAGATLNAPKSQLYQALRTGMNQPDAAARANNMSTFLTNWLPLQDVEQVVPDLIQTATSMPPANTMYSAVSREMGIDTLAKYHISEGIAVAFEQQILPMPINMAVYPYLVPGLNALASYGDAARWTLPTLREYFDTWDPASTQYTTLASTIAAIEAATSAPTMIPGLPVANPQVVTATSATAITLTGIDSAGNPLSYAIVTPPAHGTLTGTPPNVTYTPAASYVGLDRFTFKTNDGTSDSTPGTVSIIIGTAGTGLKGDYYNNLDFGSLKVSRTDPTVNFNWAYGSPDPSMGPDTFSVRWTGKLLAPETAAYQFSTLDCNGARLWINGVQVLNDFLTHPLRWKDGTSINLTAGRKYDVVLEYFQNTGAAVAKLKWTGPSFAGANGVVIDQAWLYDGSAVTNATPVAQAQSVTTAEDAPATITLYGGDAYFDTLTYAIATPPAHGTVSGTPPNVIYTPAPNYNGTDSFTFTVNDGTVTSAAATVSLTITPVNDVTLTNAAADYAGYTATMATLHTALTCDAASYTIYAYWGTTDGGTTAAQWANSATVGTFSSVIAAPLSQPVTGLTANTLYYFTFRAVSSAGESWANSSLTFGPSAASDMLTFGLPGEPAIISGTAIAWPVLSSATVGNLAPTFTLSPGATCNKASGSTQNFTNPVTYTVTAQDGSSQTYTVTVTQSPNATFTWNSTSSGNWSTASKWLNESGAAVAPASGGQTYYTLNFTNTGTYTATSDLGAGFLLNRLNFNGPTATVAGTSLTFTPWVSPYGTIAPQINQNGSSAVTISAPISMTSDLTFGGTGTGQVTLTGLVGAGSLTDGTLIQAGANTLFLNNANNGFPGGLTVNNSTLKATMGYANSAFGPQTGNWQGTKIKLINSTLQVGGGSWCSAGLNLSGTNTILAYTDGPFFIGGIYGSGLLNITGNCAIAFGTGLNIIDPSPLAYSGDVRINQGSSGSVNLNWQHAFGSGGTVTMATPGGVHMGMASGNSTSLDNYIQLESSLILSYAASNNLALELDRTISGPGGITKVYNTADVNSHLRLRAANTYSGGTVFKTGNLEIWDTNSLGTGPVTLGGKAASVPTHVMAFANEAPMTIANDFVLAGISAADDSVRQDPAALTTFSIATYDCELAGNISGSGGLLKTGANKLTLSGTNTCTGPLQVQAGTLAYSSVVSVGQGSCDITDGAKLELDYQGTRQIAKLTLNGGAALPNGNYGSSLSLAANKDDSHFAGTGMVTVGPLPTAATVTLVLTSGSNPSSLDAPLTFTATVAGSTPTGNVTIYADSVVLGAATLNASFQVSVSTTTLSAGWHNLSAVYEGDTSNQPAISVLLDQLVGSAGGESSTLTYNFSDGTLQGWNNRVWNGSKWIDLAANATTYAGPYYPSATNFSLFVPGSGMVTYTGNAEFHYNTVWLRSPQFFLNGSGNLTAYLTGGIPFAAAPANDAAVPFAAIHNTMSNGVITGGGWKGLALRRVSDGAFVLVKANTANYGSSTVTFTQAELAPYAGTGTYTLDLINWGYDFCGYLQMANVSIPGSLMAVSSSNNITGFVFPGLGTATIGTNTIRLTVPYGTAVTALAPAFTVSLGASATPASGTVMDFTSSKTYTVTAQSGATKTYTATVTVAPPAVPSNLIATPGNNTVFLTWTASSGASGYNVKRSLTNGGPYATVGTPIGNSYADTTVTDGITYYYVVSANAGGSETANSSQVSAVPAATPSTATVASSLGSTGVYGASVTFTATLTTGASGSVTFKDGGNPLGTATLDGTSQATFTTSTLALGGHPITATFDGDTTYTASSSTVLNFTITPKPLAITDVTAADKVYDGTTTANLTGGAVSGLIGTETVTVVAGGGSFTDANAGSNKLVTAAGYTFAGAYAGNYTPVQPTGLTATITARPIQLAGSSRVYDGTTAMPGAALTIANKVGGDDLALTGSAALVGKDVGMQALATSYVTPVRVQSATGTSGAASVTGFNVNLTTSPVAGNTLIAVISTRGTSANRVSGITQSGTTWARVTQATNGSGTTTEIWIASNVSGAGTQVAISMAASLRAAAVVAEYRGLLAVGPLDQISSATGTSNAASTGTTATTSQDSELWLGGIGIADGRTNRFLTAPYGNSFTVIASSQSSNTSNDAMIYALEKIVNGTGTASTSGTLGTSGVSDSWAGAITTFKAATLSTLALTGAAAGNYTLVGMTGTVSITAKPLTITGLTAMPKVYDGTPVASLGGVAAFLTSEAAGSGSTGDGKPYNVDAVTPGGTAAGAFVDANVGTAKPVTVTGLSVSGTGSGNYAINQAAGLTANITTRGLTVTANNQNKSFGQTLVFGDGSAQFTSSGLQNGETIGSVTLTCAGGVATATAAGSPYPITPSAATGGTFAAGNYSIAYVPGTLTVTPGDFTTWAADSTHGLTVGVNDGPLNDPDHDGISNLLEFALGGEPMISSQAILPVLSKSSGNWVFEYERNALSKYSTTQVVEYGNDLSGWTEVTIPPASAGNVTITPGSASDHVKVTIPSLGAKCYVRLKVSQ